MISGSTGPIFTKFSLYGRYLIADYRRDALLLTAQGTFFLFYFLWFNGSLWTDTINK